MQIRNFQYSLTFLLGATTLLAITLTVFKAFDWQQRGVWALIIAWVSLGFCVGWLTSKTESNTLHLPFLGFLFFNWVNWWLNSLAIAFVRDSENPLPEALVAVVQAEKLYCFDIIATAFTVLFIIASRKQSSQIMYKSGGACFAFWFTVILVGFITASAGLSFPI